MILLPSYRLWSLWEMLKKLPVHSYVRIGEIIGDMGGVLSATEAAQSHGFEEDAVLSDDEKVQLVRCLKILFAICVDNDLQTSRILIKPKIDDPPQTRRELTVLTDAVKAELQTQLFLSVPQERAKFYEPDDALSDDARAAFPTAHEELREASTCYSLGRNTASVVHAMRAAEIGLRALAKNLKVSFPKHSNEYAQWLELINQSESKIKKMQGLPKGKKKTDNLEFYSDAVVHFMCFKDVYRIRAAHAYRRFDEAEAAKVLAHTREFFESLAARLKE